MTDKLHAMAESVRTAYRAGEEDEALEPRVLVSADGSAVGRIGHGDEVIFYDIRGEREIEITQAFVDPGFGHFDTKDRVARFTTMIEYHSALPADVSFPPESEISGTLGEAVTSSGREMVKVVESEKAVHLSYFLNGKREEPFPGERLVTVESPKDVANYDEKPEMAAAEVTARVLDELAGPADLIIVNYANVDVVGHIEDPDAVVKAVRAVDHELGRVLDVAKKAGVTAMVTADHGTVEKWLYPDGKVDTGHTDSPVPFVIIDDNLKGLTLREGGALTDVAPTALELLGIDKPKQMTGESLVAPGEARGKASRLLLIICDGWGHNNDEHGNMIMKAAPETMATIMKECPWTKLAASGEAVGMPPGKVGNSESGHLHIGAGRRILSDRIRIDQAIADGSFKRNSAFLSAMRRAADAGKPLHLLGIVSFYSSHGSVDHLYELLRMARDEGVSKVYHHALLGRRGERPEAGARYIDDVEKFCEDLGLGRVCDGDGAFLGARPRTQLGSGRGCLPGPGRRRWRPGLVRWRWRLVRPLCGAAESLRENSRIMAAEKASGSGATRSVAILATIRSVLFPGWAFNRKVRYTRAGYVYMGLLFLVAAAAFNTGNNMLYLVLGVMLASLIVSFLISEYIISRLHLERTPPALVVEGITFGVSYRLKNEKRVLPSFGLRVSEKVGSGELMAMAVFVGAGGEAEMRGRGIAERRGRLAFSDCMLSTLAPFGWFEKFKRVPLSGEIIALPRTDPSRVDRELIASLGNERPRSKPGRGDELFGFRDYQRGDPIKEIHWKTTARSGRMMVREREAEEERRLRIVLDIHGPGHGEGSGATNAAPGGFGSPCGVGGRGGYRGRMAGEGRGGRARSGLWQRTEHAP